MTALETRGTEGTHRPWTAILAAGIVLRALAVYPSFRSPLQSDGTMTGLTALEILHGHLRVFLFHGVRLGALESYLHVPVFLVFGATRGALYLAPFLASCAGLAAAGFLARELLGERDGVVAFLLFAVPPPMVLLWTSLPFGYAETLLCATLALACAVRMGRRGASAWLVAAFGLAAGLGWWCSAQSLMGTLPAALWIVLCRPSLLRRPRLLALAAAGFVLSALPWIAVNLRYPLLSFQGGAGWQGNFALQPVVGAGPLVANSIRFVHRAASLFLRPNGPRPASLVPVQWIAAGLYLAAFGGALLQVAGGLRRGSESAEGCRVPALLLPLLIVVCAATLFIASAAGGIEGDTVRYVLPLGLAAPLLLAGLWGRLSSRHRRSSGAAALLIPLAVHVTGYALPGTARREAERREAQAEDRLLDRLKERHVAWVFGGYWDVYGLNFLSGETIHAIPSWDWADYHGYERTLGASPVSCALVSRRRGEVARWARRAGLTGDAVDIDDVFEILFVRTSPEPPAALIARLRDAQQPDPLPTSACRSRIALPEVPAALVVTTGQPRTVKLRIEHAGQGDSWTAAADLPKPVRAVRIGLRWLREGVPAADQRAELPRSLAPGETVEAEVALTPVGADGRPLSAGRYEVRIGMVQELVRWFAATGDAEVSLPVEVKDSTE